MIEFLKLKDVNEPHLPQLREAVERVLQSGRYLLGAETEAFEAEFAQYCGVRHCIGVGNGLDALHLILRAMDIGPGDEVIVPGHTFIATWLAVSYAGADIVPVEPDAATCNIDPGRIEAVIGPTDPRPSSPCIFTANRRTWQRSMPWRSVTACASLKTPPKPMVRATTGRRVRWTQPCGRFQLLSRQKSGRHWATAAQ